MKKDEIIALLKGEKSGGRGWYLGNCPSCGKDGHLGFILESKVASFTCKKCGEFGTLWALLAHPNVRRLDLIERNKTVNLNTKLEPKINQFNQENKEVDYSVPEKVKPLGFRRIYEHPYLESRGFTKQQFELFEVGVSKLHPTYKKDYILFPIYQDFVCSGYIARSTRDKEEIKAFNKRQKELKLPIYLRYDNSQDTDFAKMLFGIDEVIKGETKTVIVVEGITDKFNVDRQLNLYETPYMKCVCTFGKKISLEQAKRLLDKGVEDVIVLYDPDAVKDNKKYSFFLQQYFYVLVGFIDRQTVYNEDGSYDFIDPDPGDLTKEQLFEIFQNLEEPLNYNLNKLQKVKLIR